MNNFLQIPFSDIELHTLPNCQVRSFVLKGGFTKFRTHFDAFMENKLGLLF